MSRKQNRKRAQQNRRIRAQAIAYAQRRRVVRQRLILGGGGLVLVALVVVLVVLMGGGDDDEPTTTIESGSTTVPTTPAMASAKGKPCVKVADPLPAGAPNVPVEEGAPPATLVKKDLKPGTGAEVKAGDELTVHYIGVSCSTGKIFDSSYSRNQPATFALSGVIPGWQEGLPGMKVGGQRLLGIPSEMAYSSQGRAPTIAPDEALWFVVEVQDAKAPSAATTTPS